MSNPYAQASNLAKARRKARAYDARLILKPSTRKGKKLDAFLKDRPDKKIASFGAVGYTDYILSGDKKRRAAYRKRHAKDLTYAGKFTAGKLAYYILW